MLGVDNGHPIWRTFSLKDDAPSSFVLEAFFSLLSRDRCSGVLHCASWGPVTCLWSTEDPSIGTLPLSLQEAVKKNK